MDCCDPIVVRRVVGSGEGCCEPGGFQRRYTTKDEELATLKSYRDQLKKELDGVEEHLKNLKSK